VLFGRLFDRFDDGIEIGPIAGFELGVQELAVGADLEGSARGRNKSERRDAFSKFKNFGRQTDGLRRVVSDYAVFDRNFSFHRDLLSSKKGIDTSKLGQGGVSVATIAGGPCLTIARGSGCLGIFGAAARPEEIRKDDK
jgi:hypothetical protein